MKEINCFYYIAAIKWVVAVFLILWEIAVLYLTITIRIFNLDVALQEEMLHDREKIYDYIIVLLCQQWAVTFMIFPRKLVRQCSTQILNESSVLQRVWKEYETILLS